LKQRRDVSRRASRDGRNFRVRLVGAVADVDDDDDDDDDGNDAATECGLAIPPTSLSFAAAIAANFNGIVALSPQNDSATRDLSRRQKRKRSFSANTRQNFWI